MKKGLWWAAVVVAAAAVVIGVVGADKNPDANPLGGVALAIAAFVFLKASEGLKEP
jgi:hypothetical protein